MSRDYWLIYTAIAKQSAWIMCNIPLSLCCIADFDETSWQADVSAFCKCCDEYGLPPAVERSCSGNGAHVWLFLFETDPGGGRTADGKQSADQNDGSPP